MLSSRPSLRLHLSDDDTRAVLETRPASRFLYLGFFAVLLLSMLFSMEPERDFSGGRLYGTLLFFLLILLSFSMAVYSRRLACDTREGYGELRHSLLILPLRVTRFNLRNVSRVVLRRAVLIRRPREEKRSSRAASWFNPAGSSAHELATLRLELGVRSLKLDASTDAELLRKTAQELSRFLSVPFSEIEE